MRIAILSDVHANQEALTAVLAAIDAEGVDHLVCLGDVVGYYAEPDVCVDLLRARCATSVVGNHDLVAAGLAEPVQFGRAARHAILWTRQRITRATADHLAGLPLTTVVGGAFLAFHAALHPTPNADLHLTSHARVAQTFDALADGGYGVRLGFFGHTHRGVVYERRRGRISVRRGPTVRLEPDAHYLINPGSVGQPRDGDPRASFLIWDSRAREARFHRVAYDVGGCLAKADREGLLLRENPLRARLDRWAEQIEAGVNAVRRRLS